jgi:hypothetical protein
LHLIRAVDVFGERRRLSHSSDDSPSLGHVDLDELEADTERQLTRGGCAAYARW